MVSLIFSSAAREVRRGAFLRTASVGRPVAATGGEPAGPGWRNGCSSVTDLCGGRRRRHFFKTPSPPLPHLIPAFGPGRRRTRPEPGRETCVAGGCIRIMRAAREVRREGYGVPRVLKKKRGDSSDKTQACGQRKRRGSPNRRHITLLRAQGRGRKGGLRPQHVFTGLHLPPPPT